MPKSDAQRARDYLVRKRQRARESGLCYTCCKRKPPFRRTICGVCNAANLERQKRQRQAKREASGSAKLIEAHERAGDIAREHHSYDLAARHYKDGLHISAADESARMRLSEKLAVTLWLGNEPGAVSVVNDGLLAMYRAHPERSAEHVKTLLRITQQLWVDSRTQDSMPVLREAIRIAELSNNPDLLQQVSTRMAHTFMLLSRFEEADRYLRTVKQLCETHNIPISTDYYVQKGIVAAGLGHEREAFASFDQAVKTVAEDQDPYDVAFLWQTYACAALAFGRARLERTHHEHALLAARRNNIGWLIPFYCLIYAKFLMYVGEYASAREYLLEALSVNAQTPILDEMIVYVGIPLALHMRDEPTLKKCVRPNVISLAFLSGEPLRIGSVVIAFARLHVERGQRKKAQTLLHRAVEAMNNAAHALEVPLEIARSGAKADLPKARKLIEARVLLPCAYLAEAYLQLFDAFVAQREGRVTDTYVHARKAAARFDELGWGMYADLARTLLPLDERSRPVVHHAKPFSGTHAQFTGREREIAALILKGLTNRAMADALHITENTVEKHVTSVMNKLGIRSRYQVPDHLTDSVMRGY